MELINVQNLTKKFKIYQPTKGFTKSVKSIFKREYKTICAVNNINFSINKGEVVGFIGDNGAGKSTTIKMLCGLVVPTSGSIQVMGVCPHIKRKENARNIGVLFGQRSKLQWDLPMKDTFELHHALYKIDDIKYKNNVDMFVELLEMQKFYTTPVRQLSLGQRMRVELAVALLHSPPVVYLDVNCSNPLGCVFCVSSIEKEMGVTAYTKER